MDLDRRSLASFRILVGVARADRELRPEELEALNHALGEHAGLLAGLLEEQVDLDAEIALLSEEERRRVYQSAFALAYADGDASYEEVNLMKQLVPNEGERTFLGQVLGETLDTILPSRILAEADPVRRDLEITEDILKYSVLAAVAGAMPVPGVAIVADIAVIAIQAKMVNDIGQYWGHSLDREQLKGFMGSVAGSALVRIGVNNLARFIPGWGSLWAASTSFVATYAIGRVAQQWFAHGLRMDTSELKSLYEAARTEGQQKYAEHQERITTAEVVHGKRLAELNEKLANGTIDRVAYERELAALP